MVMRYAFGGTDQGDVAGVASAGRDVSVQAISMVHVRNGKIIEEFEFWDDLDVLQQLGVEIEPQSGQAVGA